MARHRGLGISAIEYPTGMNQNGDPSQAWLKMKPDGRVDLLTSTTDPGTGSRTVQTQIAAEALGIPYDWITHDNSSTDSSPYCTGTFASRATFIAGNAVLKAALAARSKLLDVAGRELGADPGELDVADGEVFVVADPERRLGVPDVAAAAVFTYGEMIAGTGAQGKPFTPISDPETGAVETAPHSAISYAACAAEVEVDDVTGAVFVEHLWQCFDVGRAINPAQVEGQIRGGATMGLGLALLEACYPYYPSVEHRGSQVGSYLLPGLKNLPTIDTIVIENSSDEGPYGAKGIGEMAGNPQAPAIAAAVYDAVGVWITELPITPERVLRALDRREHGPRLDGKWVIYDEDLSVDTLAHPSSRFRLSHGELGSGAHAY